MSSLSPSNLGQRVLTALVVLPLVTLAVIRFPQAGPWTIALLLLVLAASEAHTLLNRANVPASRFSFLVGCALFLEMAGMPDSGKTFVLSGLPIVILVGSVMVAIVRAERLGVQILAGEAAGTVCGLLIGLGAGSFAALSSLPPTTEGTARIAFLLAVVISSDVFAYFVGHAVGRHKLAPQISPGKTVEGALGGLVGAGLAAAIMVSQFSFFKDRSLALMIAVGVLVAIAGIAGDLLESLFKRFVGAKDSGTLFPGHGGALDRIDAFLLAAPLLHAYFSLVS